MALQKPELSTDGGFFIIKIAVGSADDESLLDSLSEILPLLEVAMRCEEYFAALTDAQRIVRLPGIAAQHLMYQAKLTQAIAAANLLARVIDGRADIADHGFPEFGLESGFDV